MLGSRQSGYRGELFVEHFAQQPGVSSVLDLDQDSRGSFRIKINLNTGARVTKRTSVPDPDPVPL